MPPNRKKQSILVVDDDHEFTEMMLMMLTQLGYTAVTCDSPRDALRLLSSGPEMFDAAIVDEMMPEMKGPELVIELLRIKDDMPVILVTRYGDLIPLEKVCVAGFRAALSKPVLKEHLHMVLKKVLGGPA